LNDDFLDLISEFNAAEVRYLLVGGYAVGIYGYPRATKDLDLWIDASSSNASSVMTALRNFGAPLGDLQERDFATPGTGFMMGLPPRRIDILTQIDGVQFEAAWPRGIEVEVGRDVRCRVIGRADLLANKSASARPQDLADIAALESASKLE
jgi:hypothetical protein